MHSYRSYKYPLTSHLEPLEPSTSYLPRPPTPIFAQSMPSSAEQILHYNNLIAENQELFQDNKVLLMKLEKYEKLEPYINTIIGKNIELEKCIEQCNTQNIYLGKNIKELHVDNKNKETLYENRIRELNELIQQGKDNGNRVRLQNQNLGNKIKIHLSEIQQYKKKLQEALMEKIHQEELNKEVASERDRLVGELKQLESYNKEIARNAKNKEDQLLEKLDSKEKGIKMLEKDIQELQVALERKQQERNRLENQLKQLQTEYQKLSHNHETMLNDHRTTSLRKAELEQLYDESLEKIARREEQLKELQLFRQEEREIYRQQFSKVNMIFEQQKYEYQQALQHKSIKNQKLTEAYNELMERIQYIQAQIWELEKEIEIKIKENKQKEFEIDARQKEVRRLEFQLEQSMQRQQVLTEKLHCMQEDGYGLHETLMMLEKKYQAREDQFEAYVKNMRIKHETQKTKWDQLFEEEKSKLKMTHEYERRDLETLFNKKVMLLEGQIEDYRSRLSRAEEDRIARAQRDIIEGKVLLSENNRFSNKVMDRSFQRRSIEKKDRDKSMSQFNQASGSKTARYHGTK